MLVVLTFNIWIKTTLWDRAQGWMLATQMTQPRFTIQLTSSSLTVRERLNITTGVIRHLFQTVPGLHNTNIHLGLGRKKKNNKTKWGVGWDGEGSLIQRLYQTFPEVSVRRPWVVVQVIFPEAEIQLIEILISFSGNTQYVFANYRTHFFSFPVLQKSMRFLKKR